jgi:hypothetical protein
LLLVQVNDAPVTGLARQNSWSSSATLLPNYVAHSPLNAADFVSSIGVCTHIPYLDTVYNDVSGVVSALSYLGISHVRDGLSTYAWSHLETLANAGIKFDFIVNAQHESPTDFLSHLHTFALAHPGSISAVEGPNEINHWPVTYKGLKGFAAGNAMQEAIYRGVKADPALGGVGVYDLTLSADAGRQAYLNLGDHSGMADYTNMHPYYGGAQPSFVWSKFLADAQLPAPGQPTVVTETGAADAPLAINGVDATTQAKQILNSLVDAASYNARATYLYQLVDEANDPTGSHVGKHYGLFDSNYHPKRAAMAVRNFIKILGNSAGAGASTGGLTYAVSNLPASGHEILFSKPNGVYDIAVWAEPDIWDDVNHKPIAAPSARVTVNLASSFHTVAVYDPLNSSQPLHVYSDTNRVTLSVTDHPLIVEVSGRVSDRPRVRR